MQCTRCSYNDDGIFVPGLLVTCFLHSVFYPYNTNCGWNSQKITSKNKHLIKKGTKDA